jgi:TRAP-type mannitol/chloroaromatic compound transport system permease small subunit
MNADTQEPTIPREGDVRPARRIPLAVKIPYTCFVIVVVAVYWSSYGPTNFLYFCDVALLLTLAGIWLESALLVSMCCVGILLPQLFWLVDFLCQMSGHSLTGLTAYMFSPTLTLFARGLSLFHGWLPIMLVWLVCRLGYDRRALRAWSVLAAALVLFSYFFLPRSGAVLANPNIPVNVDYVYGFSDKEPQHWLNQTLYVAVYLAALWGVVFLPTHAVLKRIVRPSGARSTTP